MKTFVNKIKLTKVILFILDIFIIVASYICSNIFLYGQFEISQIITERVLNTIILAIIVYELFLNLFEVYKNITIYESAKEYFSYALVCMISCNVVSLLGVIFDLNIVHPRANLLAGIFAAVMLIFYRVVIKFLMTNEVTIKPQQERKRLLIIGGGEAGTEVVKNIKENLITSYNIIGIIDDDNKKAHCKINGVKILGGRNDIIKICKERKIDIIFFAISNISNKDRKDIISICQETGAKVRLLPCRDRRCFRKRSYSIR